MKDNDYSMLVLPSEIKGYVLVRSDIFETLITDTLNFITEGSKKVKCSAYCLNLGKRMGAINLLKTWKAISLASKK